MKFIIMKVNFISIHSKKFPTSIISSAYEITKPPLVSTSIKQEEERDNNHLFLTCNIK